MITRSSRVQGRILWLNNRLQAGIHTEILPWGGRDQVHAGGGGGGLSVTFPVISNEDCY